MSALWTQRFYSTRESPKAGSEPLQAPSTEIRHDHPFAEGPPIAELPDEAIRNKIEAIRSSDEGKKIIDAYRALSEPPVCMKLGSIISRNHLKMDLEALFKVAFADELESCVTKALNERPPKDSKGIASEEPNDLTPNERQELASAVHVYNRDPSHPQSDQSYERQLRADFRDGIWEELTSTNNKTYADLPNIHGVIAELLGERETSKDTSWQKRVAATKDGIDIILP